MQASRHAIWKHQMVPPRQTAEGVGLDYAGAVEQCYAKLYHFAFGLTGSESDAADLTQETYQVLLSKGETILDARKAKSWLFTTLYQQFLRRRHATRFPDKPVESAGREWSTISATQIESLDSAVMVAALQHLEEKFRSLLTIFYLGEFSYQEMAVVLGLPIGTIMSRLSRGKEVLRQQLQSIVATSALQRAGKATPVASACDKLYNQAAT
jgi:RNA polymerase sigma factor (sigma-70 family)